MSALDDELFSEPVASQPLAEYAAAKYPASNGGVAGLTDGDFLAEDGNFLGAAEPQPISIVDDDGSAFIGGWAATPTAGAAPAAQPEPEVEDPRLQWQRQHAEALKVRDKEESATKQATNAKAKEYIAKFYDSRKGLISSRHKDNRTDADAAGDVPASGTPWEKVTALVNLSASSAHTTDVTRYKETLVACKTRNVAIRG